MAQTGSSIGMVSQSLTATVDPQGNALISSDTAFGSSPAGVALLGQQLFGLPNATFNLTPPDVYSQLGPENELPYWSFDDFSDGVMTATPVYDSAAQTWGITINPGTAVSGDYCLLTTRSYLLNDDNLGLRQKAFAVIAKTGTAAGSTEWNLTLNAIYYDTTNNPIGTATIGTALDTGTWSSISGFTTTGGTAIPATARYVELQFKVAATATITGTAAVTIKSCLLSSKVGANSSFIVAETFTSSTTWTVPAGVTTLLAVVGLAAGGGGAGGSYRAVTSGPSVVGGSGGGGGGRWSILRDVAIGTATSISIGIGAGGAGGTAAVGTAGAAQSLTGGQGAAGAATTVGTILTALGGGGGTAVAPSATAPVLGGGGGTVAGVSTSNTYGIAQVAGTAGGAGGSAFTSSGSAGSVGNSIATADQLLYPYTPTFTTLGAAGGSASVGSWGDGAGARSSVSARGTAGTVSFWGAGGAGGGGAFANNTSQLRGVGDGGNGSTYGAGGAGGASAAAWQTTGSRGTVTAGAGGSAGAATGCGGGGGGSIAISASGTAILINSSGAGGAGAAGFVTLVFIA